MGQSGRVLLRHFGKDASLLKSDVALINLATQTTAFTTEEPQPVADSLRSGCLPDQLLPKTRRFRDCENGSSAGAALAGDGAFLHSR